jgi:chemotaxis signal transduction protein
VSDASTGRGAKALREAFDAAFVAPPPAGPRQVELPLLLLRAGAARVAVRVLETGGLVAPGRIEPVPSGRRELLGVSGLRGTLLPIYGLARLLGIEDAGEVPRWLLLAGGPARVGLAFGALEGYRRVAQAAVEPAGAATGAVREVVQVEGTSLSVVSIPALLRQVGLG